MLLYDDRMKEMEEYISTAQVETLQEAIANAIDEQEPERSVQKLISYFGTDTACDRICVYEFREQGTMDNTFEWCDENAQPLLRLYQNRPLSDVPADWMTAFCTNQKVLIRDMQEYAHINEEIALRFQKIDVQRLIAVPMFTGNHLMGFTSIYNPAPEEIVADGFLFDIMTEFATSLLSRRDSEKQLHFLTERDPMTGLYNLNAFHDKVREIAESRDKPLPYMTETPHANGAKIQNQPCIIYINTCNFKEFNNIYGYRAGDQCLKQISQIICDVFETDVVCRSYSDHFYIYYDGPEVEARIRSLHEQCLGLRKHFKVIIRAGICPLKDPGAVFKSCDAAKITCDEIPDDSLEIFNTYSEELLKSMELEKYIRDNLDSALRRGNILTYFQPVVRTSTGKLCSFEALARWDDPKHGFLSPGVFIPVLEKHHRCYKIDMYIMEECCRILSQRLKKGLPCVPVSFNISRTDFTMCDPVEIVSETARKYGIDPYYLCIEITESSLMESPEEIRSSILRFRQAGFKVWMDDFGSAYSSLSMLKDYEFNEIKLDMGFMRNLNQNSKIIVISAIRMAQRMGIHTLCEGVETDEQLDFLRKSGCEKIQGFYYGRPMPLKDQVINLENKGVYPESRDEAERMESRFGGYSKDA